MTQEKIDAGSGGVAEEALPCSYGWQHRLRRIQQALVEGGAGDRVLCMGDLPLAARQQMEAWGGEWTFQSGDHLPLPQDDGAFDWVVLIDQLAQVTDAYAFMADVHRVLKAAGMLYIDSDHHKRWTFWRPVRRLCGLEPGSDSRARLGYTERGLFDLLKDGFDLQETHTYSRFFTEGVETLVRLALGAFGIPGTASGATEQQAHSIRQRWQWIQSVAYPFFVIARVLDWLLFFTRGYRLSALARRRLWKPRRTPVLRDGRTLVDATLNTRIGTAAPF